MMESALTKPFTAVAALLALGLAHTAAPAAEPTVKGPESVADWNKAGNAFITASRRCRTTPAAPRT